VADYTQAQLTAIRTAIARGEKTVQWEGRSVTYRSMDELFLAEARILKALATPKAKQILVVGDKGFSGCDD
jgi:hypothetical protein